MEGPEECGETAQEGKRPDEARPGSSGPGRPSRACAAGWGGPRPPPRPGLGPWVLPSVGRALSLCPGPSWLHVVRPASAAPSPEPGSLARSPSP